MPITKAAAASRAAAPLLLLLILLGAGVARAQDSNVYSPRAATVGEEYSYRLQVKNVVAAKWEYVKGDMPPGIDIGQTSGLLFGQPTEAGTYAFTVKMTDTSNQSFDYQLELVVNGGGAPTLLVPLKGEGAQANAVAGGPNPGRAPAAVARGAAKPAATKANAAGDEKPILDRPLTESGQIRGYVPVKNPDSVTLSIYPAAPENADPLSTYPITLGADGRFSFQPASPLARGQRVRVSVKTKAPNPQTVASDPVAVERETLVNMPINEGVTEVKGVADKGAGTVHGETAFDNKKMQVAVASVNADTGEFTLKFQTPLTTKEKVTVYRDGETPTPLDVSAVAPADPPALQPTMLEGARTITGHLLKNRTAKVEVQVLPESGDSRSPIYLSTPMAVNPDNGEFTVALPQGLTAGQRVQARVQNSEKWSDPETVETLGDWGRVRGYFGIGMMLSKEAASFSRRDLYLNFNIDSNWYHRPRYSDVLKEAEQKALTGGVLTRFAVDDRNTTADAKAFRDARRELEEKLRDIESTTGLSERERMILRRRQLIESLSGLSTNPLLTPDKRELIQQVVDKLQQNGVRHWDVHFNTFFDTRLTPVPVSGQGSAASGLGTDAFGNFVTNEKGALIQVGGYMPIFNTDRMTWDYQGSRNAVFLGPTARVGVQTLFNKSGLADPKVFEDNDLFNFFAVGARFGHYKLSGSDDRAAQLISYLDIMRGRWQNLERRVPTGEKNAAGEEIFVRRRPLRWALEGRLKIPAMPFVIGFDSNIGEGPDDLRFLFGTNFDVAQLFNLLR